MKLNYLTECRTFFNQIDINSLSTGQIALWFALLNINNVRSWCNEFSVPISTLQAKTGLSRSGIIKARNKLKQLGYIDFTSRSSSRKSAIYHMESLATINKDQTLTNKIVEDGNHVSSHDGVHDSSHVSNHVRTPYNKQTKTNKNKLSSDGSKIKSRKQRHYDEKSIEFRLAEFLYKRIRDNNSEFTKPNLQKWADVFRLMIERDKRNPQRIRNLIDWCQNDDFWKTNILSAQKFRKQYSQLRIRALAEWKQNHSNVSSSNRSTIDYMK